MKKDFIFAPIMLVIGILLFMLRTTGMTAHIIISVLGIVALATYTVTTKKEWKLPILEIAMRVLYGIAFITGIVIMNIHGVVALSIIHKISAILSFVAIVVLFVHKAIKNK